MRTKASSTAITISDFPPRPRVEADSPRTELVLLLMLFREYLVSAQAERVSERVECERDGLEVVATVPGEVSALRVPRGLLQAPAAPGPSRGPHEPT